MSNPQHEPTMEEILASIRKIISEDSPEAASETPPAPPPEPASAAESAVQQEQEYVLELTQEIEAEDASVPAREPEHDVVFEPVEPAGASDIFSETTRKAMDDVFAAIPDVSEPPAAAPTAPAAPIAPVDGATVESVFERAVRESFEPVLRSYLADNSAAVIERMKPVIREWMDEHFPALLEGAVRAEVERVVKSRGTKR
jgi:cell pole-organizing protein PopZ